MQLVYTCSWRWRSSYWGWSWRVRRRSIRLNSIFSSFWSVFGNLGGPIMKIHFKKQMGPPSRGFIHHFLYWSSTSSEGDERFVFPRFISVIAINGIMNKVRLRIVYIFLKQNIGFKWQCLTQKCSSMYRWKLLARSSANLNCTWAWRCEKLCLECPVYEASFFLQCQKSKASISNKIQEALSAAWPSV